MSHSRRLTAAALAAVAIVGAAADANETLAAACARANVQPAQSNRSTVTRATSCLINAERHRRGLPSVRLNPRLSAAARGHSRDMVRRHYFSHTTPQGSSFVQRIRRSGYLGASRRSYVGENLAWGRGGRGSAQAIVRAWMKSPPHRKAIPTPSYRDVGIGVGVGVPTSHRTGGATHTADVGVKRLGSI
jgi:uncharacterized protein YkwD